MQGNEHAGAAMTINDARACVSCGGDALPPGFVRAVLDDSKYADELMEALERRVIALEEVASARGIRRIGAAWRLGRKLRTSVEYFPGHSFTERRFDAASTEWGR
jgi:hypothetical protein